LFNAARPVFHEIDYLNVAASPCNIWVTQLGSELGYLKWWSFSNRHEIRRQYIYTEGEIGATRSLGHAPKIRVRWVKH